MLSRSEPLHSRPIKEVMVSKWTAKGVVIFFSFNGMFNHSKSMSSI